jgi:hypothetical protein
MSHFFSARPVGAEARYAIVRCRLDDRGAMTIEKVTSTNHSIHAKPYYISHNLLTSPAKNVRSFGRACLHLLQTQQNTAGPRPEAEGYHR